MKTIPQLEQEREHAQQIFAKADAALAQGRITKVERDAYLAHEFGTSDLTSVLEKINKQLHQMRDGDGAVYTHKATMLITSFFLLMITLFTVLLTSTGGITGAVVHEHVDISQTYTSDIAFTVTLNATTRINVTGSASGAGDVIVTLTHEGTPYELYAYRHAGARTAHASLEKETYALGEEIVIESTHVSSAYLKTETETIPINESIPLTDLAVGEYTITLLIDDGELTQESLDFAVVETPITAEEAFNSCSEACHVNLSGDAQIAIAITGDAQVTVNSFVLTSGPNEPPQLTQQIPDISGEEVSLDLTQYFTDPDGDPLYYSSTLYDINNETIEAGVLHITGTPGTYTYIAYASDLDELISSNIFTVTITGTNATQENQTNETQELPPDEQEQTPPQENVTEPEVNVTEQVPEPTDDNTTTQLDPLNCNDPDPNRRSVDCLTLESDTYFEEDVYLENVDRQQVARVSAIGNLLLTGRVIQNDGTGSAGSRDFTIGYKDSDFTYVPTIWIDDEGNLHLRGTLHEENTNLLPSSGSFTIMNRRGVFLAYADKEAGDLYVRGNVIPYRSAVTQ